MDIGFETIGNATLLVYDGGPVLATDPWFAGSPYFGSWSMSHAVPPEQMDALRRAPTVWVSHGHPDHLDAESMEQLRGRQILLPDHEGGRVRRDLEAQGHRVRVLRDREWVQLSPRVRVLCVADANQDAVLLADVDGRLVVDLNDASDRGWGRFVRRTVSGYRVSFLLSLAGFGDADMMNFFDEQGRRLPLPTRTPLGRTLSARARFYGTRYAVPFSAMHRFQREDSAWANAQSASLSDYADGFDAGACELLPAFVRWDCARDEASRLDPPALEPRIRPASDFGDDWAERLDPLEKRAAADYFRAIEHLPRVMDFVRLRVGGEDTTIALRKGRMRKGLTFETPRGSLCTALRYEIFDDLLIGNFMKVVLHGDWGERPLYPDFTPYVAKYADNGGARTLAELRRYRWAYLRRDPVGFARHRLDAQVLLPLQAKAAHALRSRLGPESHAYRLAKSAWWGARRLAL